MARRPARRPTRRLTLLAVGAALATALGCYQDPNEQLDQMQQTLDLTATIEDLANRTTELQFAVDSLRGVVARQDSTLARLANLAGVPYTR